MDGLRERILAEGRNLGRGILKVDSFLNHQVDPGLIDACGAELVRRLRHTQRRSPALPPPWRPPGIWGFPLSMRDAHDR